MPRKIPTPFLTNPRMGPSAVDTTGPSSEALSPCALTDMVNVPAASTEPSNNPLATALGNELCLECSLIVSPRHHFFASPRRRRLDTRGGDRRRQPVSFGR